MTITQQRQAAKGKAFNLIMKIYHPKADNENMYRNYHEEYGNYAEQRDFEVNRIVENYLHELDVINNKKVKTK